MVEPVALIVAGAVGIIMAGCTIAWLLRAANEAMSDDPTGKENVE